MFGRKGFGRSTSLGGFTDPVDTILAVEAEEEVFQDIARGDVGAAMMDQAAADDFARGDTLGGIIDETVANWF
jgi:hypothetical protein